MKKSLIVVVSAVLVVGAGVWMSRETRVEAAPTFTANQSALSGLSAVVYKSPSCGCCEGYVAFLEEHGVRVQTVSDDAALAQAKVDYGVPSEARSCHTVVMDGYVIEGHVPLEALEKLLGERPDIDGIALPGMPTGTPGMPGPVVPLRVLALKGGAVQLYLEL